MAPYYFSSTILNTYLHPLDFINLILGGLTIGLALYYIKNRRAKKIPIPAGKITFNAQIRNDGPRAVSIHFDAPVTINVVSAVKFVARLVKCIFLALFGKLRKHQNQHVADNLINRLAMKFSYGVVNILKYFFPNLKNKLTNKIDDSTAKSIKLSRGLIKISFEQVDRIFRQEIDQVELLSPLMYKKDMEHLRRKLLKFIERNGSGVKIEKTEKPLSIINGVLACAKHGWTSDSHGNGENIMAGGFVISRSN